VSIEDYIRSVSGQAVPDSTGLQFSLDLAAQAQKMSQYQTQEPALWLLKGVQAAVASGAPSVNIRLTRQIFELRFVPPPEAGPASLQDDAPDWCNHLRLSLQAALSLKPSGLNLSLHSSPLFQLGTLVSHKVRGIHLQVRRANRPWWKISDPELAAVHKALAWRLAFCPIPVEMDGRTLSLPFPERLAPFQSRPAQIQWGEVAVAYHWLAERQWPCLEGPFFCLACPALRSGRIISLRGKPVWNSSNSRAVSVIQDLETEGPAQEYDWGNWEQLTNKHGLIDWSRSNCDQVLPLVCQETESSRDFLYLEAPSIKLTPISTPLSYSQKPMATLACQRWLGLRADVQEKGGLYYVNHGVLLNPIRRGAKFAGTLALIADSQIATDLSQLNVVADARLAADIDWLEAQESGLLQSCGGAINSPQEGERLSLPLSVRNHWRALLKNPA